MLLEEATGRDHFFRLSGGGAALIAILGCSAGVSINIGEEFACSGFGDNEVGLFWGCETFRAASGAIDGRDSELSTDV